MQTASAQHNIPARLRQALTDERGLEVVEWVATGAVMLALISTVYAVFTGSGPLRNAIRGALTFQAVNFGQDVTVRGPKVRFIPTTRQPFEETPSEVVQVLERSFVPIDTVAVVFDPVAKVIVLYQPTTQQRVVVQPVPWVKVTVDQATQKIVLFDPQQQQTVVFDPTRRALVLLNPVTFEETPVQIDQLLQMHLITVRWQATAAAPTPFIAAPTLSIPTLVLPFGG